VHKVEVGRTLNANAEAFAQHLFIQHDTIDAVKNNVNQAENTRVCTPAIQYSSVNNINERGMKWSLLFNLNCEERSRSPWV